MRIEEFEAWASAYDYFNRELFSGSLPPVIFEYTSKKSCGGFAAVNRYVDRDGAASHLIAMNSTLFHVLPLKFILSILAHEMAHIEQFCFGTPSGSYHNKEWGKMMKRIGLYPSATGEPGGKETGRRVSHYVLPGEGFDIAADQLLATGWHVDFAQRKKDDGAAKKNKVAFVCPECRAKAWVQAPDRILLCGCNLSEKPPTLMVPG